VKDSSPQRIRKVVIMSAGDILPPGPEASGYGCGAGAELFRRGSISLPKQKIDTLPHEFRHRHALRFRKPFQRKGLLLAELDLSADHLFAFIITFLSL
jgi:hypothetical protein